MWGSSQLSSGKQFKRFSCLEGCVVSFFWGKEGLKH
jgi:hypothetical protein